MAPVSRRWKPPQDPGPPQFRSFNKVEKETINDDVGLEVELIQRADISADCILWLMERNIKAKVYAQWQNFLARKKAE